MVRNAGEAIIDLARNALEPKRSASIRMAADVVIDTGADAWTQIDAECTVTADDAVYKMGTKSALMSMSADAAKGAQAYVATDSANINLSTADYTHLKYWVRSSVATAAGDLKIGLADAADETGAAVYVDVPALAANTWTRVVTPLSTAMLALTSVSTIRLWLETPAARNVYIDDVRLATYESAGDLTIEPAAVSTLHNTNGDGLITEVFTLPFLAKGINVFGDQDAVSDNTLTVDAVLQWFTGRPGEWNGDEVEGSKLYLKSGQMVIDLARECTAIAAVLGSELGSGEYLILEVTG